MAANDIRIIKSKYDTVTWRVESNTTVGILPGDGVVRGGTGSNFAALLTDGMPTQGTDIWIGVTKSTGTNTASADGDINVEYIGPGVVIEGRPTTAANVDTESELRGLLLEYKNFDRTAATVAGVLTIDEDEGDAAATLSLMIQGGDVVKGVLHCATVNSSIWTGTM